MGLFAAFGLTNAAYADGTDKPVVGAIGADIGPVIDDQEFDAAIPPIDADPTAPMSTIKDWEAQQGEVGHVMPGKASDVSLLPPPPADDPDLVQPLIPLASFNVEPFDDSRYTEKDESKPASVRYDYRIDGIDHIDDRSAVTPVNTNDIRSRFKGLSALAQGKGKAANGAMINARMQEDQQLLVDILSGQGYFDAQVHGSLQMPDQKAPDDAILVLLDTAPGPRYALGTIRFDAPAVTPDDLITRSFVPKPGDPIVADRMLAAEANLSVELPKYGYPFVKLGQRDIALDTATRTGDYALPVNPGPKSSFGDIVTTGKKPVFTPSHIRTIARFRKGEAYDSRKVDDLRQALVATGLYSVVGVEPQQSGVAAGDGTEYATMAVNQEAGPARTLAAQAGYSTGEGFKLQGSWTHRNLFPPEGALTGNLIAGTQEQGAGVIFRRSNAGKRDRAVDLTFSADHSNFDAYEAYTGTLAGHISRVSTPIWQKHWTYSYGFEVIASNEQDYDFTINALRRRTFYIVGLPGQITYDRSNSLLDPTKGFRLSGQITPTGSLGSGGQIYAKGVFEATGYYPVASGLTFAGRARMGMIEGAAREEIAPSQRFYAGGGGSVRGYGYQQLGPKDPDARPIGGRSLVEAAAEARYRFGNYGVVGFVDAGQVYTSSVPRFDDWRFGVGLGGRFYTNFGPMRLDVATPIARQPGESLISVYVSIGQAF